MSNNDSERLQTLIRQQHAKLEPTADPKVAENYPRHHISVGPRGVKLCNQIMI
ncbi:MAG: hypothetical protein ACI87L_002167, partial [Litorivivens sp.]